VPEYLAPGVYVEETSFRPQSIEGVSTSTAGFVGPARFGPIAGEPPLLTSFADFERIYGGLDELDYAGTLSTNYLAHGVRSFFEEGGRRCFVARIEDGAAESTGSFDNDSTTQDNEMTLSARYPGVAGDLRIRVQAGLGQNVLVNDADGNPTLRGVQEGDSVLRNDGSGGLGVYDVTLNNDGSYTLTAATGGSDLDINDTDLTVGTDTVRPITLTVNVEKPVREPKQPGVQYGLAETFDGITLSPNSPSSIVNLFPEEPETQRQALSTPFFVDEITQGGSAVTDAKGGDVVKAIFDDVTDEDDFDGAIAEVILTGGSDGDLPAASVYEGDSTSTSRSGLAALEDLDEVSIVAAPGYSQAAYDDTNRETIQGFLIAHAEQMRYRIVVLDAQDGLGVTGIREQRSKIDSKYAALYYPWVTVFDPVRRGELNLPPSGFVAGIYARNDTQRGVQKAPANETVRLAIGLETRVNRAQQEVLNPDGINCFRFFEGRGYRLWGARTATSNNEFKYVNIRRYLAYLERSVDEGTQVFVFESNGDALWANVRRTVASFLDNEWRSSRLMGLTPEEAFFVRCDRSTMTQNDIDNGRLICEIGVALFRPAEFVIFRIGQKLIDLG